MCGCWCGFWRGYAPQECIIDNTNLARWRGTGSRAVVVPEMAEFARQYGFIFRCHELLHCNRKAGEERGFWTVETNFLPGRSFEDLADLNRQACEWATVRLEHRPLGKSRLIPAKAFEHERSYLRELSPFLTPPYRSEQRGIDQYGYTQFQANYYWVPGTQRDDVKLLIYADRLKILQRGSCVADHSQTEVLKRYLAYDCLVIDEVGYVEVEPAQVGLFFTLMQKRHHTKTTLITSNLGFSEWGSFLKNAQLTSALIDRLTATSHVINLKNCRSLRDPLDENNES